MDASNVTLSAEALIKNDRLLLHYEVTNPTNQPIYLVNRVFQWTEQGFLIKPELIYTELVDNHLKLTKACIEIPDNIDVEAPIVPFLTQVDAGSRFEESFSLSLPIVPYHPYAVLEKESDSYIFNSFELVIGWLSNEEFSVQKVKDANGNTQLSGKYTELLKSQHLLKQSFNLQVPAYIKP
ncbi:MAG TPA: hypothetical protein V6D28_16040 [Leptolyngbyaceae cyanobacterium]